MYSLISLLYIYIQEVSQNQWVDMLNLYCFVGALPDAWFLVFEFGACVEVW